MSREGVNVNSNQVHQIRHLICDRFVHNSNSVRWKLKKNNQSITNLKQSEEEEKSDYEADLSAREIKPSRSALNSIQ